MISPTPFEHAICVVPADIDGLGHVNNIVYLRWVQEAATAHWCALVPAEVQATIVWVVLRHEIDYKIPARLGDAVVARTWVGAASGITFERHTEIVRTTDRQVLARARTLWCPINAQTGRPQRISADLRARLSAAEVK